MGILGGKSPKTKWNHASNEKQNKQTNTPAVLRSLWCLWKDKPWDLTTKNTTVMLNVVQRRNPSTVFHLVVNRNILYIKRKYYSLWLLKSSYNQSENFRMGIEQNITVSCQYKSQCKRTGKGKLGIINVTQEAIRSSELVFWEMENSAS